MCATNYPYASIVITHYVIHEAMSDWFGLCAPPILYLKRYPFLLMLPSSSKTHFNNKTHCWYMETTLLSSGIFNKLHKLVPFSLKCFHNLQETMMGNCLTKIGSIHESPSQYTTKDKALTKKVERMKENSPSMALSSKSRHNLNPSKSGKKHSSSQMQSFRSPLSDKPPTLSHKSVTTRITSSSTAKLISPSTLPLSVHRNKITLKSKLNKKNTNDESKADENTRRMLDKNKARLLYANDFKYNIEQYLRQFSHSQLSEAMEFSTNEMDDEACEVKVYVRKRPLFKYEKDAGEFDVIGPISSSVVTVNDCRMLADMKRMQIRPVMYPCSYVFGDECNDDTVFVQAVKPLIYSVINNGGNAAVLMFGQTGSGKSHTMSGIEERTANEIFELVRSTSKHIINVKIQFIEICGKNCKDLLSSDSKEVKFFDGDSNSGDAVCIMHATSIDVENSTEFLNVIKTGKNQRAVARTDKNATSSRSHALCRIILSTSSTNMQNHVKNKQYFKGAIDLLDLAGTERRNDSLYHDPVRQKETNEINSSLWALKECIRARATHSPRIPYRSHALTRALRGYFEQIRNSKSSLSVIATITPTATDTEHTMETLKTASIFMGFEHLISELPRRNVVPIKQKILRLHPKKWNNNHMIAWLKAKNLYKGCNTDVLSELDGKALLKMTIPLMKVKLCRNNDEANAEKIFKEIRSECDRVSKEQLKVRLGKKQ